jgi:hypothetical protein
MGTQLRTKKEPQKAPNSPIFQVMGDSDVCDMYIV